MKNYRKFIRKCKANDTYETEILRFISAKNKSGSGFLSFVTRDPDHGVYNN